MATTKLAKPNPKGPPLVVEWVFRIAIAGVLGYAGAMKLAGFEESIYIFQLLHMEPEGRVLIGLIEMGCAVTLLTKWASVGSLFACGVMIGAILAHTTSDVGIVVEFKGVMFDEPRDDGGMTFMLACGVFVLSAILLFLKRRELPFVGSTL